MMWAMLVYLKPIIFHRRGYEFNSRSQVTTSSDCDEINRQRPSHINQVSNNIINVIHETLALFPLLTILGGGADTQSLQTDATFSFLVLVCY